MELEVVPYYKTTDGKHFLDKEEAEEHEAVHVANEVLVKTLVRTYQWVNYRTHYEARAVGGRTLRGDGWQFVPALDERLEEYTRYVISQIKEQN